MNLRSVVVPLLLAAVSLQVMGCASGRKPTPAAASAPAGGKSVAAGSADELDEYATDTVSDPIEPVNRGTFWLNHQLYRYVLKPVSKTYQFLVPKFLRQGLDNAYDNVRYPIRVVNHTLQGNLKRAGYETGKFALNTTFGVGGLGKAADRISPACAAVPPADTGQTFAKWGIPRGPYIVLPILGPSTARETFGLAGDYALNPITWLTFIYGEVWVQAIPYTSTVRSLPGQMDQYEAATGNALDRYLAARTAYIQYRNEINRR